ncbi:MAG: Outer membrane protein MIP [Chlamydiae bacterium]|nr:Outer membrane protein MIP [Chlamydiota bacterium]
MSLRHLFISSILLASASLWAAEKKEEIDIEKVSEAFGHLIGKNIDTLGVDFDIKYVIKGLQDSRKGDLAPMSEGECVQAISAAQENAFKTQASENLAKAEAFLKGNGRRSDVVSMEEGKVQYKIEQKGKGALVEPHFSPKIKYVGKYLDGTIFGASEKAEMISLDETIAGFTKGLVGMREGEKRTLYIHPDCGYGTAGYLPPNSLLTFEIEVVEANSVVEEPQEALTLSPDEKSAPAPNDTVR